MHSAVASSNVWRKAIPFHDRFRSEQSCGFLLLYSTIEMDNFLRMTANAVHSYANFTQEL